MRRAEHVGETTLLLAVHARYAREPLSTHPNGVALTAAVNTW